MTYTIKYTDILAFQKRNLKKDHTATINKIFNQISKIKSNLLIDDFVSITFDETVKFVDPLFFILLFDVYCEYKSTVVIDIRYMDETSQHYVHRILTQYSDLEKFKTYSPYSNNDVYIPIDIIEKDNTEYREQECKRFLEKETLHLFTRVAHKKSLINDNTYEYSMLPILRLRNFDLTDIDTAEHEDALEPYDKRMYFYNQLSLDQSPKEYRTNLQNKIEDLLVAVGLGNRGLSSSFRDIFFELIDNIRKHTPSQSNAHISFRKDTLSNLYELIVSDNSDRGFLDTYRETLDKELQRLKESGLKEEYLQNYTDVIEDINSKHYNKVLKGLFQVQKSTVNDTDEEMHIHQIPRIAMHFGLPLLVRLLEKLSKSDGKGMPELKLFLHNDNQFFEIIYSFQDGISSMSVNCNSSHTKIGTYIIIIFPEDVKMLDSHDPKLTGINFKNSDYKLFINKQEYIKKQINQFTFFLDKHIATDLDRSIKTIHTCENKCVLIKFTGNNTFSEFLRNIYLYAYKYEIEDVVVSNVPLFEYQADGSKKNSENIEHIKLLEAIIYGDKKAQYAKSLNILFYSDRSPEAVLVGGRNQKEYCYLNNLLPNWYGGSVSNIICPKNTQEIDGILLSNLFISIDTEDYILPFELFEIENKNKRNNSDSDIVSILGDMLEIYLNEVAKKDDVHIDTGTGYHIDRYMEFKKVFEDSRWVRRLAFRLAMQFPKKPESKKYYLYGTDKYTNMLISLCYTFLDLTFDRFRYKLFNIYDDFDYDTLKQKIKMLIAKNTHEIYLVSSVVVNAKKDLELIEDNKDYGIKAIPAIQLGIGNCDDKIKPIVSIKSYIPPIEITDKKYCYVCEGQRKIPLLEFTKNDPFFIKDTFFDIIPSKKIESYSNRAKKNVKLFDSLNFGHVERGNNHFLYYINTIKFFNQNRNNIEEFLKKDVSKKINYSEKEENIILFTSSHDTNNNFVALVNQEVFSNNAIVLSFNKSRGEANFHDLDSYISFDWENTRVFFVDDSIASSHTVKYFYQMLRSVPCIMKNPNVGLDGIIVMIDRISSYDETILCSYLRDNKDIDKPNDVILKEKLEEIHAFSTFDIKPIKSEVEKCFLCTRNKRYLELAKKSALDLTTFQMVKRANKLEKVEYRAIQPAKEKTLEVRFKNYLKAMATTYIYKEFANKEYSEFKDFNLIHKEFSEKMYKDIIFDKNNRFSYYDENVLKEIVKFQSEIALIKACSSPRLSYYYNIRRWIISIVSEKLSVQYDEEYSFRKLKKFTLKYKLKSYIDTLSKNNKLDGDDEYFLEYYRTMTSFHLFNIYFVTLGYFEDSRILDWHYIELFYQATHSKDLRDFKGGSLLHTYPFAVKFTIANNLEKSIYFEKNLNKVLDNNNIKGNGRIKKYSYLNALKLENTLYWKYYIKKEYNIDISEKAKELQKEQALDKKIEIIKDIFNSMFKGSKVFLFISPYATIMTDTYKAYLENSQNSLINILDSHKNINSYNENMVDIVQKVFYGAVDVAQDNQQNVHLKKVSEKDIIDKISDTWANDYDDKYCVVRLTSIDNGIAEDYTNKLIKNDTNLHKNIMKNNPVWFRPIGCIVVENNAMSYQFHMDVSRMILSIKEYIVTYIEKEFSYGVIQEAINKKKLKQELQEGYKDMLTKISHSVNEYINIERKIKTFLDNDHTEDEYKQYLEDMAIYSWGLEQITSLSQIERDLKRGNGYSTKVSELFNNRNRDTDFKDKLESFISVAGKFSDKLCKGCNIDFSIDMQCEDFSIEIEEGQLKIIIFELVFNALRRIDINKNAKIKIIINKGSIAITNSLKNNIYSENGIEKRKDNKINEITEGNSRRMGIQTVKKSLTLISYHLEALYNEDTEMMEIRILGSEK
jgi:signal transduction histidine kinase